MSNIVLDPEVVAQTAFGIRTKCWGGDAPTKIAALLVALATVEREAEGTLSQEDIRNLGAAAVHIEKCNDRPWACEIEFHSGPAHSVRVTKQKGTWA